MPRSRLLVCGCLLNTSVPVLGLSGAAGRSPTLPRLLENYSRRSIIQRMHEEDDDRTRALMGQPLSEAFLLLLLLSVLDWTKAIVQWDPETELDCPVTVDPRIFYASKLDTVETYRAYKSIPRHFRIAPSYIPGARLGVFCDTFLQRHTWLGEYQGEFIPRNYSEMTSAYAWTIRQNLELGYYVDAWDERTSNWLRFVNCARTPEEENVKVSQCLGRVYYRLSRDVWPGTELLVYYGEGYAKYLGIDVSKFSRQCRVDACD